MNLNILAAHLMLLIISLSGYTQTYNTTINCHFANIIGEGKIYVLINDIKVDSIIAKNGIFTWKGNLNDLSFIQFNAKDYIKYPPKFLLISGTYNIDFDTVTRFFNNPLSNERSNFTAYKVRENNKLVAENEFQKLIYELGQLDSSTQLSTTVIYQNKKERITDFIEKQNTRNTFILINALGRNNARLFSAEEMENYFSEADSAYKNSVMGKSLFESVSKSNLLSIGKPLTNFEAMATDNSIYNLNTLQGNYVFVDFWASWCKPCRAENPLLRRLYETYRQKNFEIVSFSLDDNADKWKDAIEKDSMNWIHISDLKGWKFKDSIANKYGINAIPDNVLIDPQGIIIDKGLHGILLEKRLKEIFD